MNQITTLTLNQGIEELEFFQGFYIGGLISCNLATGERNQQELDEIKARFQDNLKTIESGLRKYYSASEIAELRKASIAQVRKEMEPAMYGKLDFLALPPL